MFRNLVIFAIMIQSTLVIGANSEYCESNTSNPICTQTLDQRPTKFISIYDETIENSSNSSVDTKEVMSNVEYETHNIDIDAANDVKDALLFQNSFVLNTGSTLAYFSTLPDLFAQKKFKTAESLVLQHAKQAGWLDYQNLNRQATIQSFCRGSISFLAFSTVPLAFVNVDQNVVHGIALAGIALAAVPLLYTVIPCKYVPAELLGVIQHYVDKSFANACKDNNYEAMSYLLIQGNLLPVPSSYLRAEIRDVSNEEKKI